MDDDGEDLGAIAWPGFVDILSSVIIMFVFFVMIVASALYFHIIIFKSKVLSEESKSISAQATAQELATTNRSLMKKIEDMTEKMKLLEKINEENEIQLYKEDSEFAESIDQKLKIDPDTQSLIVFFGSDSISVTKPNQKTVIATMEQYIAQYSGPGTQVTLESNKNPDSINDVISRRLSVARMLNVRNLFLETDIPPNQIIPRVTEGEAIDGTHNWVKITFSRK